MTMKFKSEDGKAILYAERDPEFVQFHAESGERVFGDQFSTPENFDAMIKRERCSEIRE